MDDDRSKANNSPAKPHDPSREAAVNLIRQKVESAYKREPKLEAVEALTIWQNLAVQDFAKLKRRKRPEVGSQQVSAC